MIEENAKLSPNSYDVVETTCCHRTRLVQLALQVTKIKNSDLLSPVRYIPSNGRDADLWIELQVWLWLLRGQSSWHIKSSVKDEWTVTDRVIINPVMRILKKRATTSCSWGLHHFLHLFTYLSCKKVPWILLDIYNETLSQCILLDKCHCWNTGCWYKDSAQKEDEMEIN